MGSRGSDAVTGGIDHNSALSDSTTEKGLYMQHTFLDRTMCIKGFTNPVYMMIDEMRYSIATTSSQLEHEQKSSSQCTLGPGKDEKVNIRNNNFQNGAASSQQARDRARLP